MKMLMKASIVAATAAMAGGMASSAQAANWYGTDGTQTYELTAGTTYLQVGSGPVLTCTDSRLRAQVNAASMTTIITGPTYPGSWANAVNVEPTYDNCSLLATGTRFNAVCTSVTSASAAKLTGTSTTGTGTASVPNYGGATVGSVAGISCLIRTGSVKGSGTLCSTITGSIGQGTAPNDSRYNNPTSSSTYGSMQFAVSSEALTSTTPPAQCLGITNGAARYATNTAFTGNVVYNVATRGATGGTPTTASPGLPIIWQG